MRTQDVVTVPNSELVCDCEYCAGGRLVHWFCDSVNCAAPGPFKFSPADPGQVRVKSPYGQRQYNKMDGLVGGIRRWCSAACAVHEERVYLMDLLEKAQLRGDLSTIRVVTGRLHEMEHHAHADTVRTLPEKLTRRDPPPPPVRAISLVPEAEVDLDVDGSVLEE